MTSPSSVPQFSLATTRIEGTVGGSAPLIVVPMNSTRPWLLRTSPTVRASLRCGSRSIAVHIVVVAPDSSCLLVFTTPAHHPQSWQLAELS
jgi:hypothetical protein